jgi:natural product biosynthesis luciferase-like monooxygenase protein
MHNRNEEMNQQLKALLSRTPAQTRAVGPEISRGVAEGARRRTRPVDFSFIFFSDANLGSEDKYELVFNLAEFGDRNGFKAVWIPERHFHPFGGIYPNPAVLAAAIAARTRNIRLRSGSVVLPLHHPTAVVESWAMVDNLSGGRVDMGFASGWNPNDFVAVPENYEQRRELWHERIPMVQRLWRGEALELRNGKGEVVQTRVYPRPLQDNLDVWLVITKSDDSFRYAGRMGYNILHAAGHRAGGAGEKDTSLHRSAGGEWVRSRDRRGHLDAAHVGAR